MPKILAKLPAAMRDDLKEPLGEIYTDTETLLAAAGEPVVTVGDIVTHHLLEVDRFPEVAFVDGKTKRERVEAEVMDAIGGFDTRIDVTNPRSTITDDLLGALSTAMADTGTTVIVVDGEEDLASLPAILAVPEGGSVVYGQPDEGMVLVPGDADTQEHARTLVGRMQSDLDQIDEILSP